MIKSFLTILSLSTLLFACKSKKDNPTQKTAATIPVVDAVVALPQTVENIVEANGTVVANEFVTLQPETSGKITYLNVPEGKPVTAGTIIARVNDADLQAQLAKSKTLLNLAEITEQRDKKLLEINGINQSDYDAALNQVQSIQADIQYTKSLIEKTVVKAPFSGVVGLRQVSLGTYVSPTVAIATIQQVDKLKIDFTLPEEFSYLIKKGGTVDVQIDQAKEKKTKAVIIATEPQVTQSTRNLKVRVVLPEGSRANPGAYVKVYVDAGVNKKALMVPTNSLIPDDKNNQIIIIKNGVAAFVNVQTGVRTSNNVEITKGVSQGDTVVVTGVLFVRPKSSVKVRSVKTLDQFAAASNNTN